MSTQMHSDLQQFHQFLGERLVSGGRDLSPEQVLDEWRVLHPADEELAESVTAVRRAIAEMKSGDQGRHLDAVLLEIRQRIAHPSKQ